MAFCGARGCRTAARAAFPGAGAARTPSLLSPAEGLLLLRAIFCLSFFIFCWAFIFFIFFTFFTFFTFFIFFTLAIFFLFILSMLLMQIILFTIILIKKMLYFATFFIKQFINLS
jgi:hypothetical protein